MSGFTIMMEDFTVSRGDRSKRCGAAGNFIFYSLTPNGDALTSTYKMSF
jgi:hypothetical protein